MIENIFWTKRNMSREILAMVAASLGVALFRYVWLKLYVERPQAFPSLLNILLLPLLCICLISVGVTLLWGTRRSRSWLPAAILAVGVVLAFQVPFPPRPLTPQELNFSAQRADYAVAVNLIRLSNTKSDPDACFPYKVPPENPMKVSCIRVSRDRGRELTARFYTLDSSYSYILYIETVHDNRPCMGGAKDEKIEEHWYVCFDDAL